MKKTEENLLEHAFINQLETDFNDQDNKMIIIEYLSDTAKENWLEGRTNCRF